MKTVLMARKQISIPAELCDQLGIKPGWQLDWHAEGHKLVAVPVPPRAELIKRIRQHGLKFKATHPRFFEDFLTERARERARERTEDRQWQKKARRA